MSTVLAAFDRSSSSNDVETELVQLVRDAIERGETVTVTAEVPSMTPQEMADRLDISRTTVMRKIQAGEIRTMRKGNRHLIPETEFEAFKRAYVAELGQAFAEDF